MSTFSISTTRPDTLLLTDENFTRAMQLRIKGVTVHTALTRLEACVLCKLTATFNDAREPVRHVASFDPASGPESFNTEMAAFLTRLEQA